MMICRLWRGWTTKDNADAYERIVRGQVIPASSLVSFGSDGV